MSDRIAARYPRRRTGWWVPIAIVFALVGGTWLLWTALHHANPDIAGRVKAFTITSDTDVSVTLTVDRPDPSVPGRCTLIAQSVNYQQVGELVVDVPPGTVKVEDLKVSIRTIGRATSASLEHCVSVK